MQLDQACQTQTTLQALKTADGAAKVHKNSSAGVNFTNVLSAAFTLVGPKSAK